MFLWLCKQIANKNCQSIKKRDEMCILFRFRKHNLKVTALASPSTGQS